ncbi:MAG: hypothetical protein LBR43_02440 [Spiroplasmataceae bacterium]|nr:hypothetical protein [Spiroplasmataceae bacterium]
MAIDPSGTGTTGVCLISENQIEFKECQEKHWQKHYDFITSLVKVFQPSILLFESTNFINSRNRDSLSLLRILGAIECLAVKRIESVNVLKVKETTKLLLAGKLKISGLDYQVGRGKGWMFRECKYPNLNQGEWKRINIHQLEAFIVYWIWKEKNQKTSS